MNLAQYKTQWKGVPCPLNDKQLAALHWTSLGHTAFEVGVLVQEGEHFGHSVLKSARRILGAVNTTHAVTIAIREGWI